MKKRIISIITVLILSVVLALNTLAAGYDISVSDFEAKAGEIVTVEIKLNSKVDNVINASFSLEFDPEVLQIVKNGANYSIEHGKVFEDFAMLSAGNNTVGYANFGGTAAEGTDIKKGVIYSVEFEVLKEENPQLTLTVDSFSLDKEEGQRTYPSIINQIAIEQAEVTLPDQDDNEGGNQGGNPDDEGGNQGGNPDDEGGNQGGNPDGEQEGNKDTEEDKNKDEVSNSTTSDNFYLGLVLALMAGAAVTFVLLKKKQHN